MSEDKVAYLYQRRAPHRRPTTAKERLQNAYVRINALGEVVEQIDALPDAATKLEDAARVHEAAASKGVTAAWHAAFDADHATALTCIEEAGYHALAAKALRARLAEPREPPPGEPAA